MSHPATGQNEQNMLHSVERARRVLSESGRTLVRATDETQFLQGMCRIAVELAGYSMAWVGFARHDEARSIEAVASAGDHAGYLLKARISWADIAIGRGPSGKAVRSGRPQVAQDLHSAADFAPWLELALGVGHQAAATLPLVIEGEVIGVFTVFAAEADAFGAAEMELLDGVARDIAFGIQTLRLRTAQEQAEAGLKASQRLLQATFEQAPAGIAHIDAAGRIILANKKLETILGYGPGELVGLTVRKLSHAEDIDATAQERARLTGGEITSFTRQKRYLRKDGATVWVGLTVSLMHAVDGTVLFDIAVFEDITERVRLDALLRLQHTIIDCLAAADSESTALQSVMGAICIAEGWACARYFRVDEAGGVLRMAQVWAADDTLAAEYRTAFRAVTYAPGEGLAGKTWQTGQPAWSADMSVDSRVAQPPVARNRGLRGACIFPVRSAGAISGVLIFNSREVREPDQRLINAVEAIGGQIGLFLQRKHAEAALRASEARFRSLTALSADGYWETDEQHRFVTVVEGGRLSEIFRASAQIGKTRWELPNTATGAAGWIPHRAIIDAHQPFVDFEIARAFEDGKIAYLSISGEPMFGEGGTFTGYQGVARDITVQKEYEAQLLELNSGLEARVARRTTELERANKELEAFSYSVAHDLRAPLRAIGGFSAIVLEQNEGKLDAVSVGYLRRAKAGSERMGELVDDLLNLARISRQPMRRQEMNLGQLAGKVIGALKEAEPQRQVDIQINAQMSANCDPALIEIALINLIGNAWKFTGKMAAAHIEVGVESREGQSAYFVRDNGAGFSMEYVKNLFEPFHRLHKREDFEGSGIGLSLVKRIIERHGGRIWAESEVGKGACFYFILG